MNFIDLKRASYPKGYQGLIDTLLKRIDGAIPDTVLLLEHEPVITLGRLASETDIVDHLKIKEKNIPVIHSDRGGKATCHEPGQLVIYPVIGLSELKRDLCYYLSFLEAVSLEIVRSFGLEGDLRPGTRGVWINGRKIVSIGIGIKKWVTYHGISINVSNDLGIFNYIEPCGTRGMSLTTIRQETGRPVTVEQAKDAARACFEDIFNKYYQNDNIICCKM